MATPSNTIIIGAGIIGVSTAYYLSQSASTPPESIHLVEAAPRLFASASGYAGGFLARDWFGSATATLGALSFDLHKELAEKHGGRKRWGYSTSRTTSVSLLGDSECENGVGGDDFLRDGRRRVDAAARVHEVGDREHGLWPDWWMRREGYGVEVVSEDGSTAQVDPLRLCQFLLDECRTREVQIHHPAKVISVSKDMRGELAAARVGYEDGRETDIPCTRLVITAGAWTPQVFQVLFPASKTCIPVSPLAGHSLVVRSPSWSAEHEEKGCQAVFAPYESGFSPELFSRIGGEIYFAGLSDNNLPLPIGPTDARPQKEQIARVKTVARRILGLESPSDDLEIIREGLCFRPVTKKGPPIVARVGDDQLGGLSTRKGREGGIFISAGHGPWGISQSLGTGMVLSEMIEGRSTSADVEGLSL